MSRQRELEAAAIRTGDLAAIERAAPEYPAETCPQIDSLQVLCTAVSADLSLVSDAVEASDSEYLRDLGTADDVSNAQAGLETIVQRLEFLREANDQLRRSGRYWHAAARRLAERDER